MARRTVVVSDLSGREVPELEAVRITLIFADGRKSPIALDAHSGDPEVEQLSLRGHSLGRRGRPRKNPKPPRPLAVAPKR